MSSEIRFAWDDPFLLENQLIQDERMLRDAAAAFAADKLVPRIEQAYFEEHTDPARSSPRWARRACSALPSRRSMADWAPLCLLRSRRARG